MSKEPWLLRRLLALTRLLPPAFRERFRAEIEDALIDRHADAQTGQEQPGLRFWMGAFADLGGTVAGEWIRAGLSVDGPSFRHACRGLTRRPGYALASAAILGFGVAGAIVMLTTAQTVVLAPLPYAADGQIGVLFNNGQTARPTFSTQWPVSQAQFDEFKSTTTTTSDVTWVGQRESAPLLTPLGLEEVAVGEVAWNFFHFLGINPAVGRVFADVDLAAGSPQVVVLSNSTWRGRYGADPGLIGSSITLNGRVRAVLGVLPADFDWYMREGAAAEFWIPEVVEERTGFYDRWLLVRPADGRTLDDARLEFGPNAFEHFTNPGFKDQFAPSEAATAIPLRDHVLGDVARRVPFVAVAVTIVLILACTSLTLLGLGRVSTRSSELAVRRALGSSRGSIWKLVATETAGIAALGAGLGLLGATWGLSLMRTFGPAEIPRLGQLTLDGIGVTTAIVLGVGLWLLISSITGGAAARASSMGNSIGSAVGGSRTTATRKLLLTAQVAAAVTLLVGASLATKSWIALETESLGFDPTNVLSVALELPEEGWAPSAFTIQGRGGARVPILEASEEMLSDVDRLVNQIAAFPSVVSVGVARHVPLSGTYGGWSPVTLEGWEDRSWGERPIGTSANWVDAGYFEAMGVSPVQGRLLARDDALSGSLPVAVVSESFAQLYWPGESAIGKRFYVYGAWPDANGTGSAQRLAEVVGVVRPLREKSVREANVTTFLPYQPFLRYGSRPPRDIALLIKTDGRTGGLADHVRRVTTNVFPTESIKRITSMESLVASEMRDTAFLGSLMMAYSGYAMVLALAAIIGAVALQVGRRQREVGIRLALGARDRHILPLFGRELAGLVALGGVVGMLAAVALSDLVETWLYGVDGHDLGSLTLVPLVFVTVAYLTSLATARRALSADPAKSLSQSGV